MSGVFVVGSANLDYVLTAERRPGPGETVTGATLATGAGGKGANQAVAAARLGARVSMLGLVGDDAAGRSLVEGLRRDGVDTALVGVTDQAATGAAFITVTPDGENSIVVASGANHLVTVGQVEEAAAAIRTAGVLLLQLELPIEVVARAAAVAADAPTQVVLNLAPPADLPAELLAQVDVLVANEHEAAALLGEPVAGDAGQGDADQVELEQWGLAAARAILTRGPRVAVVTLGAAGAVLAAGDEHDTENSTFPGIPVPVVDTTGAGDAFVGAMGAEMDAGVPVTGAVAHAVRAGAAAVRRPGAQGSFPSREDLPWTDL